jgi:hypothetical protein
LGAEERREQDEWQDGMGGFFKQLFNCFNNIIPLSVGVWLCVLQLVCDKMGLVWKRTQSPAQNLGQQ